eukprot:3228160-Rhodomonas_salina.1
MQGNVSRPSGALLLAGAATIATCDSDAKIHQIDPGILEERGLTATRKTAPSLLNLAVRCAALLATQPGCMASTGLAQVILIILGIRDRMFDPHLSSSPLSHTATQASLDSKPMSKANRFRYAKKLRQFHISHVSVARPDVLKITFTSSNNTLHSR